MTEMNNPPSFEVPLNIVVDNLRNEVARLNDERLAVISKLQFQAQIIEALQHQLQHAAGESHGHGGEESPHDHLPAPDTE